MAKPTTFEAHLGAIMRDGSLVDPEVVAALRDAWEVKARAEAELAALDQQDLNDAAWEQRVRQEAEAAGEEALICHVSTQYDAGYREAVECILGRGEEE